MAKLSTELNRYFFDESREKKVTLSDILTLAGDSTFGFLFVILALPSALPIPAPGYSTPFGVAMLFLAIQLIIGRHRPWLPAKMLNWSIPLETVQGFVKKGIPWLQRVEALTKPRLSFVCNNGAGRVIIGIALALMSISMMIVIPGTNTLPAMGIFVTGFGLVEDDGVICLVGLILCALGAAVSTSILIAVIWGGSNLIDVLRNNL